MDTFPYKTMFSANFSLVIAPSAILLVVTLPSFNGAPFGFCDSGIETFWLIEFDIRTFRNIPLFDVVENPELLIYFFLTFYFRGGYAFYQDYVYMEYFISSYVYSANHPMGRMVRRIHINIQL